MYTSPRRATEAMGKCCESVASTVGAVAPLGSPRASFASNARSSGQRFLRHAQDGARRIPHKGIDLVLEINVQGAAQLNKVLAGYRGNLYTNLLPRAMSWSGGPAQTAGWMRTTKVPRRLAKPQCEKIELLKSFYTIFVWVDERTSNARYWKHRPLLWPALARSARRGLIRDESSGIIWRVNT